MASAVFHGTCSYSHVLIIFTAAVEKHIIHCKLRLGLSDLNYDLLSKHLTTNNSCYCGERKETSQHYILHCPPFTHVRHNTIFKLPANVLNISTLLQGDPNMSNNMNSLIFKAVLDFLDVWLFRHGITNVINLTKQLLA